MLTTAPKVLVFGNVHTGEEYSRSYTVAGAIDKDLLVGECLCGQPKVGHWPAPLKIALQLLLLFPRFIVLSTKYLFAPSHTIIFVPFPSHIDGLLAIILARLFRKKLILDFLYGLYDTVVVDRGMFSASSVVAKTIYVYERGLASFADKILIDTHQHGEYLASLLRLDADKFAVVPVGIDEKKWADKSLVKHSSSTQFTVIMWSTFIPLHGIDVVIKAAKLLEDLPIIFKIIGTGQTASEITTLTKTLATSNVEWQNEFVEGDIIRGLLQEADVCLGIFSASGKAQRVIPYKVYQSIAASKALVTARSPAIEDVLVHGVSAMLTSPGDANALADAIRLLRKDPALCERIARKGNEAYKEYLSLQVLDKQVNAILHQLHEA
jgi:glycosyltransferase involved in cell wall biosynthesis